MMTTKDSITKRAVKFVLSIFLVYHVSCIVIMPNGLSFLGRQFQGVFFEYARVLGIATNWALFAPDPADPFYMHYRIYKGEVEIAEGFLPEAGPKININPGLRRQLYFVRQMIVEPSKIERIFAPWLCRRFPDADRVDVRSIVAQMPMLDTILAYSEAEQVQTKNPLVSFYCAGEPGYYFD